MQAPKQAVDRKDPAATPSSPESCSLRAESAKATASLSNSWTPEARRVVILIRPQLSIAQSARALHS
jgi:hypothetical protein